MVTKASEPFNSSNGDVILRSSDPEPVDFHVHKFILSIASTVFKDIFSIPHTSDSAPDLEQTPVVEVSERAEVIDPLLRLVYPTPEPPITSLDTLEELLVAADKYNMPRVTRALSKHLINPGFLEESPLRVFALAAQRGLEDEARIASSHTLTIDIFGESVCNWAKCVSVEAKMFHRLAVMHYKRRVSLISAIEKGNPGCSCSVTIWGKLKDIVIEDRALRLHSDPGNEYTRAEVAWRYLHGIGTIQDIQTCEINAGDKRRRETLAGCALRGVLLHIKSELDALPSTI